MSDVDDVDADLLGLIDDNPSTKTDKRRKKADLSDSDGDDDSGNEDMDVDKNDVTLRDNENPYPLEGKYKNEEDRLELLELDELEREDILASRQEELQRLKDSSNISRLFASANTAAQVGDDSVASAAKRQHKTTGSSKEKKDKLEELKSKREAKNKRKSNRRDDDDLDYGKRVSSDEESDEESEEGEVDIDEEQELDAKANADIKTEDIHKASISRSMLVNFCYAPFFEDFVKGTFVRYLLGAKDGKPDYRLCEVTGLGQNLVKPYAIEDKVMINQQLVLSQGRSEKACNMDKVSNQLCTDKEFDRFIAHAKYEKAKLPTKNSLKKVHKNIQTFKTRVWTEEDINSKLNKKSSIGGKAISARGLAQEKAELQQRLYLAKARRDTEEIRKLSERLNEIEETVEDVDDKNDETQVDKVKLLNERNRKANQAQLKRVEERQNELKRLAIERAKEKEMGLVDDQPMEDEKIDINEESIKIPIDSIKSSELEYIIYNHCNLNFSFEDI